MEFANQQKKVGISTLFHTYQIMLISVIVYLVVIPTLARGAGLEQLEHIIIFMQENRPFDHYFGTLSGVRGFNDRATVPLKSGLNVFYQAVNSSETEYMLPYRVDSNKVAQFISNVLFKMSYYRHVRITFIHNCRRMQCAWKHLRCTIQPISKSTTPGGWMLGTQPGILDTACLISREPICRITTHSTITFSVATSIFNQPSHARILTA